MPYCRVSGFGSFLYRLLILLPSILHLRLHTYTLTLIPPGPYVLALPATYHPCPLHAHTTHLMYLMASMVLFDSRHLYAFLRFLILFMFSIHP